jgi:hypothetical protein
MIYLYVREYVQEKRCDLHIHLLYFLYLERIHSHMKGYKPNNTKCYLTF